MTFAEADQHDSLVQVVDISKRFGGVHALRSVSLTIESGTVHALVGENGAGKSTLGRVIAGLMAPDSGRLIVESTHRNYRSAREAIRDGIVSVAQETKLVPQLTVLENVFLGIESSRAGFADRRAMLARYETLTSEVGFRPEPHRAAGSYSIATQQQIEILRALARSPKLLVLDEPTAALTPDEIEKLFETIRRIRDAGRSVLYVSHFLEEVLAISDTISVLKDGELIRTASAAKETPETLVRSMVGRPMGMQFPERLPAPGDAPVSLSVQALQDHRVGPVSFEIRAGEIVGIAGLMGSGRTRLARLIFGAERRTGGTVRVYGASLRRKSIRKAIGSGMALLPESRKDGGLVLDRPINENLTLVHDSSRGTSLKYVSPRSVRHVVERLIRDFEIKALSAAAPVASLSGGNQQKVALAKWFVRPPSVLIVDEPTRGVDIGAKQSIYRTLTQLAADGAAILVVSSEVREVIELSHRILVMREGQVVAEMDATTATEAKVMLAAFGQDSNDGDE